MNESTTPTAADGATASGNTASGATATGNVAGNTYDKYASTNPIERRMMAGFFEALDTLLEGVQPSVIAEVGAGEGRVTERLVGRFPNASVVGLDLPDSELAREHRAEHDEAPEQGAPELPDARRALHRNFELRRACGVE